MTTATEKTTRAARSSTRKRRKKREHFPHTKPFRFGEAERAAIEETRLALTTVRGREATFSEAVRRLVTDKAGVADVEARALVIANGAVPSGPVELPPETLALLTDLRHRLGHCQGSLNSIAKRLAYANKELGFRPPDVDVEAALDVVFELRALVGSVEHQLASGVIEEVV